jgi:hypothetical protein
VIKFRKRHSAGRRPRLAVAAVAAVAGCIYLVPAGASAAEAPVCGGSLEINNDIPGIDPPGGMSYKFDCSAQVVGYALLSSRQVDYFSTEVLVSDINSGEVVSESFGCEGAFPGSGFGCRGLANNGNFISGEFAIGRDPCDVAKTKSDKFKVWVSATVTEFDSVTNKPFVAVTQPFRLKAPNCGSASGKAAKRKESRR